MRDAQLFSRWIAAWAFLGVGLSPSIAAAGWGSEKWGELIWGALAVPLLGPLGLALLSALILGIGVFISRWRRSMSALVLALLVALPLAASALMLPHTFVNGTVADADEVNANFEALAYRTIPRATGLGPNDQTDFGAITSRTLTLDKDRTDTAFRISYTDNFRVVGNGNTACRWEIRVDGSACSSGALVYDYYQEANSGFHHRPSTFVGYCESLAAGSHTLQVFVGPVPGTALADCFTDWNDSRWVLEAEEVR